jgi:hypothetical protein
MSEIGKKIKKLLGINKKTKDYKPNKTTEDAEYNGWKKFMVTGNEEVAKIHPNYSTYIKRYQKEKAS